MDIKEYISSGIIERYVLDAVSSQEKQEVECMSHIYPEIGEEVLKLQQAIEQMALKSAVPAPTHLKNAILSRIKETHQDKVIPEKAEEKAGKIITMNPESKRTGSKVFQYVAAACVIGIIGMTYYSIKLGEDKNQLSENLAKENQKVEKLEQELLYQVDDISQNMAYIDKINNQLIFLKDKNTTKIPMNGTANHPDLLATVFWNTSNEKVVLEIQNLPIPPSDKQYQLWAIIDGLPTDMGVFELNGDVASFIEMKNTSASQAFAITLEPKGGSVSPTLEEMYVVGAV